MPAEIVTRMMETVVMPPRGGAYTVMVHARPRPDGRWEGVLEYRPREGGESLMTPVETTQSSARAVIDWAAGLGVAFLEGSFERAWRLRSRGVESRDDEPIEPPAPRLDGPLDPAARTGRIERIALEILAVLRGRGTPALRTDELFNRTTHANADLVRAFELLEKEWRFIVRRTDNGVDRIEVTPAGAAELSLPVAGTTEPGDPPQPPRTRR